ncbi:uncharacterized, partial [Tachysurus ichikawai]
MSHRQDDKRVAQGSQGFRTGGERDYPGFQEKENEQEGGRVANNVAINAANQVKSSQEEYRDMLEP